MHDAAVVQVGQRVGDLGDHVGGHGRRQRAVDPQPAPQVLPVDQVQHQGVGVAATDQLAGPDDARVVQVGEDPGLRQERLDQLGLLGRLRPQQLDGHPLAGTGVPAAPDGTDGALGDLRLEFVPAAAYGLHVPQLLTPLATQS